MLYLLLILLLTFVVLAALLWGATQLGQGLLYEEPVTQLFWRAPAAAAGVTGFFLGWCLLNYAGARPGDAEPAYDTLFNFSAEKTDDPVAEFWAAKAGAPPVHYRKRLSGGVRPQPEYYDDNGTKFGATQAREADEIVVKGKDQEEAHYKVDTGKAGVMAGEGRRWREDGGRRTFDEGGRVTTPRPGGTVLTLLLNVLHLVVWFACLWLILRFQWPHALGLAAAMWLVMTFVAPNLFAKVPRKPAATAMSRGARAGGPSWDSGGALRDPRLCDTTPSG